MEAYLLSLQAAFQTASLHPAAGRSLAERAGYFRIESGRHVIFYRRALDGIIVMRVLHEWMEPRRHLPH